MASAQINNLDKLRAEPDPELDEGTFCPISGDWIDNPVMWNRVYEEASIVALYATAEKKGWNFVSNPYMGERITFALGKQRFIPANVLIRHMVKQEQRGELGLLLGRESMDRQLPLDEQVAMVQVSEQAAVVQAAVVQATVVEVGGLEICQLARQLSTNKTSDGELVVVSATGGGTQMALLAVVLNHRGRPVIKVAFMAMAREVIPFCF